MANHPYAAVVDEPLVELQIPSLWMICDWKFHMEISVRNVDEAMFNRNIDAERGIARSEQIILGLYWDAGYDKAENEQTERTSSPFHREGSLF
jgi:hypothetical protein